MVKGHFQFCDASDPGWIQKAVAGVQSLALQPQLKRKQDSTPCNTIWQYASASQCCFSSYASNPKMKQVPAVACRARVDCCLIVQRHCLQCSDRTSSQCTCRMRTCGSCLPTSRPTKYLENWRAACMPQRILSSAPRYVLHLAVMMGEYATS